MCRVAVLEEKQLVSYLNFNYEVSHVISVPTLL